MSEFERFILFGGLGIGCCAVIGVVIAYLRTQQRIRRIEALFDRLLVDGKGGNFEDVLTRLFVKIDQLSLNINHIGEFQQRIREQLRLAVQKKAMVRFNPFEDAGGDQSFALVLLDEKDNGVILSSLHGRGTTRMYAKHIEGGKSPHQLTEEEKAVLAEAIGKK